MKSLRNFQALGAAVLLCTAAASALAAGPVRGSIDGRAYQTGGVDWHSRAEMQRHAAEYDARVSLSEGWLRRPVANAKVDIYDASGNDVFSLAQAGPRTDVMLPPGHYRVVAQAAGNAVSGRLEVKDHGVADVHLHWRGGPMSH